MLQRFIITAIIMGLALFLHSPDARSQSKPPRVELGVHITAIDLNEVFEVPGGVGGRFTYDFTEHFAFDAEVNYFPRKRRTRCIAGTAACFASGSNAFGETEGLFGMKTGVRRTKYGIFAKVRPGFIHLRPSEISPDFNDQSRAKFALDLGAVLLEYYPVRRLILRFDLGDTIIPFGGRTIGTPTGSVRLATGLHNSQGGAGIGIAFEPAIVSRPQRAEAFLTATCAKYDPAGSNQELGPLESL